MNSYNKMKKEQLESTKKDGQRYTTKVLGRPKFSTKESLIAATKKAYKRFNAFENRMNDQIDLSSADNEEELITISDNHNHRIEIATSIVNKEYQIAISSDEELKQRLQQSRASLLKQLDKKADDRGGFALEEKKKSVGKPQHPLVLYYIREKFAYERALIALNSYEVENGLKLTQLNDLNESLLRTKHSKVGRAKNSELENMDKSVRNIKKKILRIKQNIKTESKNKKGKGRRRHSFNELKHQQGILTILQRKIVNLELNLSQEELTQRQIKQLKSQRQGIRVKMQYLPEHEKEIMKKQIFDLEIKINEKELFYHSLKMKFSEKNNDRKVPDLKNQSFNQLSQTSFDNIQQMITELKAEFKINTEKASYVTELIQRLVQFQNQPKGI